MVTYDCWWCVLIRGLVLWFTRMRRFGKAKQFIQDLDGLSLLDVGGADGLFIEGFRRLQVFGVDKRYGVDVDQGIPHEDNTFDFVTLLAVVEHLHNWPFVLMECHRVLNSNGVLIITTPKRKAERFIELYYRNHKHVQYFGEEDFVGVPGFKLEYYGVFEFGLNQLVVLRKV